MSMTVPHEVAVAWAAGVIDSRGSICIRKQTPKIGSPNYSLAIEVASITEDTIFRLQSTFESGSVSSYPKGAGRVWRWNVVANEAAAVLEEILPFLVKLAKDAEIGITFSRTKQRYNGPHGVPLEDTEEREAIYQFLRRTKLKRRNMPRNT